MIKRIILFLILPSLLFGQISNWKDKTINQLSGIVSGTTDIGRKSYWETRAYAQIHDIVARLVYDRFYVTDYDVTPDNATEEVDAIQSAIDAAYAAGGGIVYFPRGVYQVTSDSIVMKSGVSIQGEGIGATIFNMEKATSNASALQVFWIENCTDVMISGIEIDGNAVNDGKHTEHCHGIYVADSERILIQDCYIHDVAGDGIYFSDVDYSSVSKCRIHVENVNAATPQIGRNCIAIVEGQNCDFSGNILTYGIPAAIDIEPNAGLIVSNITLTGNNIDSARIGINIQGSADKSDCSNINVIGGILNDCTDAIVLDSCFIWSVSGVTIPAAEGRGILIAEYTSGGLIQGCHISNTVIGIDTYTGNNHNLVIDGNYCYNNSNDGIRIYATSGKENKHIVVKNNVCYNNASGGEDTYSGIRILYSDSSIVTNNICYDNRATPTQNYGILASNCDELYLGMNNFGYGNKSGFVSLSSVTQMVPSGLFIESYSGTDKSITIPGTGPGDGIIWFNSDGDSVMSISGAGYLTLFGRDTTAAKNLLLQLYADTSNMTDNQNVEVYTNTPKLTLYQKAVGYPILESGGVGIRALNTSQSDTLLGTIWRDASNLYIMGRNKANDKDSVHVLHDLTP